MKLLASAALCLALCTSQVAADDVFRAPLKSPLFFAPPQTVIEDLALTTSAQLDPIYAVGDEISISLEATGGRPPYAFSSIGGLETTPSGSVSHVFLQQTPLAPVFTVTDSAGKTASTDAFPIQVVPMLSVASPSEVHLRPGAVAFKDTPLPIGGQPPYDIRLEAPQGFSGESSIEADGRMRFLADVSTPHTFVLHVEDSKGREASSSFVVKRATVVGTNVVEQSQACTGGLIGTQTRTRTDSTYSDGFVQPGTPTAWTGACNPPSATRLTIVMVLFPGTGDCGVNGGTNFVWTERVLSVKYDGSTSYSDRPRSNICNQSGPVNNYAYRACPNHAYGQQRATARWTRGSSTPSSVGTYVDHTCAN